MKWHGCQNIIDLFKKTFFPLYGDPPIYDKMKLCYFSKKKSQKTEIYYFSFMTMDMNNDFRIKDTIFIYDTK